jgi:hypothetical protein
MTARSDATEVPVSSAQDAPANDVVRLYQEGMVAGVIGAATVAVWFLVLDAIRGQPLWTPTVLGTALFRRGAGLADPATLPVSLEMVAMFTWVHGLVFAALGGIAARLLGLADRNPNFGFGILLLFVVFQFGFTAAAMLFAAPVLQALTWPAILAANLLATAAMALYFHVRHPRLVVDP